MARTGTFVGGMAIGAGLAYLLDPDQGEGRRARLSAGVQRWFEEPSPGDAFGRRTHYGFRVGDIRGLQAANLMPWQPTSSGGTDTLLRLTGGALALFGLARRGKLGAAARTLGVALLAGGYRGARAVKSGALPDRRRTVDIQKTLFIQAPIDQVYAFWSSYENFPLFMSNVREVEDLGDGRSHWSVSGPGGAPIEWDAVLTEQIPGERIAWRSEPGSMLANSGVIRFRPESGGTRVDLRFCYHPPAGGAGQAVTELLGSDPRAKLNEDLGRLKALLEGTAK
jgi:uncharacterized membrane protein